MADSGISRQAVRPQFWHTADRSLSSVANRKPPARLMLGGLPASCGCCHPPGMQAAWSGRPRTSRRWMPRTKRR